MRSMPYRQCPAMSLLVKTDIDKQLEAGVTEPSQVIGRPQWCFILRKTTCYIGDDYRRLSSVTLSDAYPLARLEDCIDSLGKATVFSTHDCNAGYWQVPVARTKRDKTTFTLYFALFRYKRMPFRLKNAPATFKRALYIILSGARWQRCLVYLDDVIVISRSIVRHIEHLDRVLRLL